ncbi:MAG: DUF402 domain-containing protein [Pyrinomonadaceae bacterium]|nr:DUF402 domain-containing protein [Pyrinomonadaceae bacterium]
MNFIAEEDGLLCFRGKFREAVSHPDLGTIAAGTVSTEYFWRNHWYNIFRFHEPDGAFRNFYCNISMPPSFDGTVLEYTDLDLDILVGKTGSVEVLDVDEFEKNSRIFGYGEEIISKAREELRGLKNMIYNRKFPFNDFSDFDRG